MSSHIPAQALDTPRMFSFFAGVGSCLGIAGGYYLRWVHTFPYHTYEEATSELVKEAWASVGDSLRYAMGSLPKEGSCLDNAPVSAFVPYVK